ncbi:helix-turn-helix domain-containing protein [Candidatus Enterococcus mansonii]|uniref:Mga helix-turn-helix domain-containing protein n=1 Tax=Candidatus Enterococcus mansonii TaxID=1834181 RepID=A0A242CF38_9ENTE|nr:helix-turn-helix domain-containing protein [Enterococcus sp. 4G2_DIV0659]OTO08392.1 hypothetical protein A5880_001392 [Enterococcus sp. 4G2_DIV0659]
MRKFDLLEKLEVYQIDLLIYLSGVGGTATKKELLNHLAIGDYFLAKLIESLMTSAVKSNGGFFIEMKKQTITFQTKSDYSLHTLYNDLLLSAPKYKILEELLLCGSIDATRLRERIGISHSTYFRKIHELNTLLKEFDLSIQNGYLLGSELQIRFFYVSLYSMTNPTQQLKSPNIDPRIYELINNIQLALGCQITPFSRKKLTLYFSLLKRRNAQKMIQDISKQRTFFHNKTDIPSQRRFISALKKTKLFKKMNEILESFLVYYSFKMRPNETVLLLLFMLGEEIIPMHSYRLKELELVEKYSNFFIPKLNMEFLSFMKKCYPHSDLDSTKKTALLSYLNAVTYRHTIFKGHIDYYWEPIYQEWQKNDYSDTVGTFINHLKQKYSVLLADNAHDKTLLSKYIQLISFYEECIKTTISVGIFIEGDILYRKKFMDWWIKHIELTTFVKAEPLTVSKTYDLVISNVNCSHLKHKGKYFFFLTNYNEKMDINDIDQLLHDIYSSYTKLNSS